MKLVILESPYAGEIEVNVAFARACLSDSLHRGESPIASHLLYTQPGVLLDNVPEERKLGIAAGLAWRKVCEQQVFYTDRGWSSGMLDALWNCLDEERPFALRALNGRVRLPATLDEDVEAKLLRCVE